jgi:hypothetical protein
MQKEHYLGFVAHFVKNVDQMTPDSEYRSFFVKTLGTSNVLGAQDVKVKDMARNMYRAYVASEYIKYSPFYLLTTLSSKQLVDLVGTISEMVDSYGLYSPIDTDLTISTIDSYIKKLGLDTYKSVLSKYSSSTPTKAAAKKPAIKGVKRATKKTSKSTKPKASTKTKPAAKKTTKVSSGKTCSELKLPELKEMAKAKKISRYSKMNKSALCAALGIKE